MEHIKSIRQIALAIAFSLVLFCSGLFVMDVHADETPSNNPNYISINGVEKPGDSSWSVSAGWTEADKMGLQSGTISYDVGEHTLTLQDVTLDKEIREKIAIYVHGGHLVTENQFTIALRGDNTVTAYDYQTEDAHVIHVWGVDHVYIEGPGSLTVNAPTDVYGDEVICANYNDVLTIRNGAKITINHATATYGIRAEKKIEILDGSVVRTVGSSSDKYGAGIGFYKGLTIKDSVVETTGYNGIRNDYHWAINADGIRIENSTVTATATGEKGYGIVANYEHNSHNGPCLTVSGNSKVIAAATSASGTALYSVHADKNYLEITNIPQAGKYVYVGNSASSGHEDHYDRELTVRLEDVYSGSYLMCYQYIEIGDGHQESTDGAAPSGDPNACDHDYGWITARQATATSDGEMRYVCADCGDVEYSVPVTAYYTFNKETQEKVLKAAQGATIKVQTPWFISFHEMVYKALQERPDVTLVVDYKNGDGLYEMTIPAGSGDQLQSLFGESRFAGFLYLGGTYATTELPRDTVFDGMSATEMWFGTTNAH